MPYIYAVSDIHGALDVFKEALKNIDLSDKNNQLILLGDYIDRGRQSCETLYFIKDLQENYPKQVIVLRGNHEEMFLEQFSKGYLFTSTDYDEIQKYLSENELENIVKRFEGVSSLNARICNVYREMIALSKLKHKELIKWLRTLPYYYETESQIYVHAGVDEESGEYWKVGCEDDYFIWKYPAETGTFYKDIIAGHISSAQVSNDENYLGKVFWDGYNHFYIDGETITSSIVPVLKYNTQSKIYSSYERADNGKWIEYKVVKR